MALFIDQKFMSLVGVRLKGLVYKGNYVWNFKCPFCGDSKKSQSKKRGYIYRKGGALFFRCHNCSKSISFANFIKALDPVLYEEYKLEKFKHTSAGNVPEPVFTAIHSRPVFHTDPLKKWPTVASLARTNDARVYAEERRLPTEWLERLYYAESFKDFADDVFPGHDKTLPSDKRIIIPFYDQNKNFLGVQGRALLKTARAKYITIKAAEDNTKAFGLDRADFNKRIFVLEGPFDSMFLHNSIATMDASLSSVIALIGDYDYVFVHDNEPRNSEILKQMERSIATGKGVCIWPQELQFKDVNDMVMGGMSPESVLKLIEDNTYTGLTAKLMFVHWRKA